MQDLWIWNFVIKVLTWFNVFHISNFLCKIIVKIIKNIWTKGTGASPGSSSICNLEKTHLNTLTV